MIDVLIALIGAAPVMAGLLERRGSDSEEGLLLERQGRKDARGTEQERELDDNPLNIGTETFEKGTTVDIDTEDSMERGAVVLGLSLGGDPDELRARFADGTV